MQEKYLLSQMLNNRVLGPTALFSKIIVHPCSMLILDERLNKLSLRTLEYVELLRHVHKSATWNLKHFKEEDDALRIAVMLNNIGKTEAYDITVNSYDPSSQFNVYMQDCNETIEVLSMYDMNLWKMHVFCPLISNPCDGQYFIVFSKVKKNNIKNYYTSEDVHNYNKQLRLKQMEYTKKAEKIFSYLAKHKVTDQLLYLLTYRIIREGNLKVVNDWILKHLKHCLHFVTSVKQAEMSLDISHIDN
jgi:hypothetical protein